MASAVSLRRSLGPWLFALVVIHCATARGQEAAPPPLQEVHIGLQIREFDGTPINYLRAKNLNVSAGGRSLPVIVTRPSSKNGVPNAIRTRLLVILPSAAPSVSADLLSEAIDQLNPVWREGWQVAVRTPQGGLTPYVASEQELLQAIRLIQAGHSTDEAAIDTLKDFPGRRVVMTVWNGDYGTLGSQRKAANEVRAMLYNVGGNPYDNYSYVDSGGMTDNIAKPYIAQAQFSVDDARTERSFGTAIRDARNDAGSYYDLLLRVDPGTSSIAVGISIDPPYQVTAQAYTSTSDPPPAVVLIQGHH